MYNETMKLEDDMMDSCEKELTNILNQKEIALNYNPVFYHTKTKFVGYISNPIFSNLSVKYESLKKLAKA